MKIKSEGRKGDKDRGKKYLFDDDVNFQNLGQKFSDGGKMSQAFPPPSHLQFLKHPLDEFRVDLQWAHYYYYYVAF